jgi:uncharacterized repeat protein (TIGR01451 family)
VNTRSKVLQLTTATAAFLVLVTTAVVAGSGPGWGASGAVPEFTNMAHLYNFLPPSPPTVSTRRASDHEFYTAIVPKRDYTTGQLLDEAGNPLMPPAPPVMVKRDFAIMGSYNGGAWVFDITNPEAVQFVRNIPCNQQQNDVQIKQFGNRWVLALARDGNTAPCITNPHFGLNVDGGTVFFDVTDPYDFSPMYSFRYTGATHNFTFHPTKPYGWVSTGDLPGGMNHIPILNFTNIDNPVLAADPSTIGGPHDIAFTVDGLRAFVASENNHRIYDTTNPAAPVLISQVPVPNTGTYAHGLDPSQDRRMMVSTNESLALGGFFQSGSSVCPGEGLLFYDIEGGNETAPVPMGEFVADVAGPSIGDGRACTAHVGLMSPDGNVMVLGWYRGGVRVVDHADMTQPVEIGKAVMDGAEVWAAKFYKGPYVFASDTRRGFDVFKWTGAGPAPWISDADLSVEKSDSKDPAPTGRNLTYTLTVTNNGPDAALNVQVTDPLPAGMDFVSATASGGSCGLFGGTVLCSIGGLVDGASVTFQIVVTPRQAGLIQNTATVSSSTGDPVLGNNTVSETTSICRITSRRASIPCG